MSQLGLGEFLLASNRERPGMLLNILQCTRQPVTTKNDLTSNGTGAEVEKPWSIQTCGTLRKDLKWLPIVRGHLARV